jgi:hypothetical protein
MKEVRKSRARPKVEVAVKHPTPEEDIELALAAYREILANPGSKVAKRYAARELLAHAKEQQAKTAKEDKMSTFETVKPASRASLLAIEMLSGRIN